MSPDHDADIGVWCFCSDCENGWEKCPVPSCEGPHYQESLEIVFYQSVNLLQNLTDKGMLAW